jgi:hypothetical protein
MIGGILLLVAGPLMFLTFLMMTSFFSGIGITWADYGGSVTPYLFSSSLTSVYGLLAIIGGTIGKKGHLGGHVLCLIVGIAAVVGLFIPFAAAGTMSAGGQVISLYPISLSGSSLYIDPFFVLMGGIIGVVTQHLEISF